MSSRVRRLLESTLPRESRRTDVTVIRVIYMVLAMFVLQATIQSPLHPRGQALLSGLTVLHSGMAVLLAVRLAGDIAGDRSSGVVGLLALAGLAGRQMLAARLVTVFISFLSAWVVRIPMLVLAFTLGGVRFKQIWLLEILLLGMFILVVGVGLLHAHFCSDRATARIVFLLPGLVDFALATPRILISIVKNFQLITVPPQIHQLSDWLRMGCISSSLSAAIGYRDPGWEVLAPLIPHLGLGLLSMYCWQRIYFKNLDEAGEAAPATPPGASKSNSSLSKSRPSRPCWDDALAWQAYQVHSQGRWNLIGRGVLGLVVILGAALTASLSVSPFPEMAVSLLVIVSGVLMFMGQGKVSDCLQRELREKTLPSLLMTPHTPMELCDGWGRGASWMMLVDLPVHLAALGGVLFYLLKPAAPVIVSGAVLMLSVRSFLILSPLVPFSFRGILSGLILIALVIVMLIVCVPLSVKFHPWLGPLVLIPLAYGWSRVCRWMIPAWFEKKQEALE